MDEMNARKIKEEKLSSIPIAGMKHSSTMSLKAKASKQKQSLKSKRNSSTTLPSTKIESLDDPFKALSQVKPIEEDSAEADQDDETFKPISTQSNRVTNEEHAELIEDDDSED